MRAARRRRLTEKQRAVLALAATGLLIRRRGSLGGRQAAASDPTFAASVTIDQLVADGLLRPAVYWGTFELVPGSYRPRRPKQQGVET